MKALFTSFHMLYCLSQYSKYSLRYLCRLIFELQGAAVLGQCASRGDKGPAIAGVCVVESHKDWRRPLGSACGRPYTAWPDRDLVLLRGDLIILRGDLIPVRLFPRSVHTLHAEIPQRTLSIDPNTARQKK